MLHLNLKKRINLFITACVLALTLTAATPAVADWVGVPFGGAVHACSSNNSGGDC